MPKKAAQDAKQFAVEVPLVELSYDDGNAVSHDDENKRVVRANLEKRGQYRPVIADSGANGRERGKICIGNCMVSQMHELGFVAAWVVWTDFESDADFDDMALTDNRSGELHSWNWEVTVDKLKRIKAESDTEARPLNDLGFTDFELGPLMNAKFQPSKPGDHGGSSDARKAESVTWKVPKKRAATIREAIERALLNGLAADEAEALEVVSQAFLDNVEHAPMEVSDQ